METLNLTDGWRVNNPNLKRYTWLQGISNKQARLDFLLLTDALMSIANKFKIHSKYRSDHAPISFILQISSETRGLGTWKFNNSLLSDDTFVTLIKKSINDIKKTYVAHPFDPHLIEASHRNLDLTSSATLFWETILVSLRGIIISYSAKKERSKNLIRTNLEKEIAHLDEKVTSGLATIAE